MKEAREFRVELDECIDKGRAERRDAVQRVEQLAAALVASGIGLKVGHLLDL